MDIKEIPLTQGRFALVDEQDYNDLVQFRWRAVYAPKMKSFYAVRTIPHPIKPNQRTTEPMHRRIMGLKHGDGLQVDHKNHITLDNRRTNLRVVTNRKNQENNKRQSKYGPGIQKIKRKEVSKPFRAKAKIAGKDHYIGCFATIEEAQRKRKEFLTSKGVSDYNQ